MLALLLLLALPAAAETVEIVRDAWGVPHIFAATPAGAAFGVGFAQATDQPEELLKNLSLSELAPTLNPAVQSIVDAYVAGVNRAFGQPRITAAQVVAFARQAYTSIHGSNDLFLPASRTTSKSVIAILDPIADWDVLYEVSMYAGELAIAGVAPVGMPFPIVGHNQDIAIGWSGDPAQAGPRAIEEAWLLITARSTDDIQTALAMNQIPGRPACGAASCQQTLHPVVAEKLRTQQTWSVGKVEALALDTEVYNAEAWQKLLVRTVPEMKFARMLSGWNRRADADSKGALAFYLFKMALARDASLTEPADSISVPRLRAALTRAEDQVETELDFNATWGTYFRIVREGARTSSPASGGLRPEAGISTPRTLLFRENRAYAGQAATRVVELSATPSARSLIPPEQAKFKPTYFRNRRELQRSASSVKTLTVP